MSGHSSCNGFGGSYELKAGNRLCIPPLASTQMACINMEVEHQFLKILTEVDTYILSNKDTELTFFNSNKEALARFVVVFFE